MNVVLRAALVAAGVLLSGCAPTFEHGRAISPTALRQVQNGMSESEVAGRIGPPSHIYTMPPSAGGGKVWTYTHSYTAARNTGVFSAAGEHVMATVTVNFGGNGKVESCRASRTTSSSTSRVGLGGYGVGSTGGVANETSCAEAQ